MFDVFLVNYRIEGLSVEETTKVANALLGALVGNEDYINSEIIIRFYETIIEINIWPEECKNPVPEMLRSYADLMIFCRRTIYENN